MSTIKELAQDILDEKTLKIIPENIKKDVEIFDITGTYEGLSGVKRFSTKQEMNSSSGNQEGDLAIVYGTELNSWISTTKNSNVLINKDTVVLPSAVTSTIHPYFEVEGGSEYINVMLTPSEFSFQLYGTESINISYASSDGITYTKTSGTSDPISFSGSLYCRSEWDNNISYFLQTTISVFEGLFEYTLGVTDYDKFKSVDLNTIYCSTVASSYFVIDNTWSYLDQFISKERLTILNTLIQDDLGPIPYFYLNSNNELCFFIHLNGDSGDPSIILDNSDFSVRGIGTNSNAFSNGIDAYKVNNDNTYTKIGTYTSSSYITGQTSSYCQLTDIISNIQFFKNGDILSYASFGMININQVRSISLSNMYRIYDGFIPAKNQFSLKTSDQLLQGVKALGAEKEITGSLGIASNKLDDNNAELYYSIQDTYDNLPYINIDDSNKAKLINMRVLPCKTDGTALVRVNSINLANLFYSSNLRAIYALDLNMSNTTSMSNTFIYSSNLKYISNFDTSNVINMNKTFQACTHLTTIPNLDTSKVTDMSGMFCYCSQLTNIPNLDTSNVTNMADMFYSCSQLTNIPNLITPKVVDMNNMFHGCTSLDSIPNLDTSNVISFSNFAAHMANLVNVPNLDTSKANTLSSMFTSCPKLINIPNLNTSNVTTVYGMFWGSSNITDLPIFNFDKVKTMSFLCCGCSNLINVPYFNTSSVNYIESSFSKCPNLSNDSLNNILGMCAKATGVYSGNRNLKSVGLTQDQTNICKNLSNWSSCTSRGWSTGY